MQSQTVQMGSFERSHYRGNDSRTSLSAIECVRMRTRRLVSMRTICNFKYVSFNYHTIYILFVIQCNFKKKNGKSHPNMDINPVVIPLLKLTNPTSIHYNPTTTTNVYPVLLLIHLLN